MSKGTATRRRSDPVHLFFEVGVILKGIDAVLEVIGAGLLVFVKPGQINRVVGVLTQHELSEDPHDFVATHLVHAASHLSSGGVHFASLYLLSHGVLKIWLVWALLKSKLWAYPVAIVVFVLFGVYQMYRYAMSHSLDGGPHCSRRARHRPDLARVPPVASAGPAGLIRIRPVHRQHHRTRRISRLPGHSVVAPACACADGAFSAASRPRISSPWNDGERIPRSRMRSSMVGPCIHSACAIVAGVAVPR